MTEKKQRSRSAEAAITFVKVGIGTFLMALGVHGLTHSAVVFRWALVAAAVLTVLSTIGAATPKDTPERRAERMQAHEQRRDRIRANADARTARMQARNARNRAPAVPQQWPPPPPQ